MTGKIISFDVDMTLVDHNNGSVIPKTALEAIDRLRPDNQIVVASGRDMHALYSEEYLKLIKPDAIIHLNGARTEEGGVWIASHPLESDILEKLIVMAKAQGWCLGAMIGEYYCCTNPGKARAHDIRFFGYCNRKFAEAEKMLNQPLYGANVMEEEDIILEMEQIFPQLRFSRFGIASGCDIVMQGVTKASGMWELLKHWNKDMSQVIAFGDSRNDLELIQEAGVGVAMGNAESILKENADFITDPIDRDGIAKALEYLDHKEEI